MALKERKDIYIVGRRVTMADLQTIVLLDAVEKFLSSMKHDCIAKLVEIKERVVKEKPGVARYLRSRPATKF